MVRSESASQTAREDVKVPRAAKVAGEELGQQRGIRR